MLFTSPVKPISIGAINIDPPLTLAPMAGQTNHAFRVLCREQGGVGLVCTELISSHAMQNNRSKTALRFDWHVSESPVAVQLFGSHPYEMAEAARIVVDHGADIVDINMGCWVPKVAKKGAGAALLKDVCAAVAVVEAIVKAVPVPVTVKVRSGWQRGQPTAVPFARAAVSAGVQAIAVHARFADQGFTGSADWDIIRQVKHAASSIPVIGNGDVFNGPDAARLLHETGCDAVMIGRGALGRPWIFRHIAHFLQTGQTLPEPPPEEKIALALRHARLTLQTTPLPPRQAVLELRGQLLKYCDTLPATRQHRAQLTAAETLEQVENALFSLIIDSVCDEKDCFAPICNRF